MALKLDLDGTEQF